MTRRARSLHVALVALLALAAGCGGARAPVPAITVFAAASLAEPFTAIAARFTAAHPGRTVDLHCAGTPQLVLQLREGARADVFASADQPNFDKVVALGLVAGAGLEFARNELAIAVAPGNPFRIAGLADLARAGLRLALCGPEVPAGRYARQALARAGVEVRCVSDETNVKALVAKVRLGELDAAIVYATDVRGGGVAAVPIAAPANVVASYPISVLRAGRDRAGGELFVAFVRSPAGRQVLAEHGFVLP